MKAFFLALCFAAVWLSTPAPAQFGGRPGDAVLYLMTSKGAMDFRPAGASAANQAPALARFQVIDVKDVPAIPLGEGFPDQFTRQILHEEPDDLFQLITQEEGLPGPHRIFLVTYKTFIVAGIVRETEAHVDYTSASATTLKKDVDFGPDLALDTLKVLFWGRDSKFPAVEPVPQEVRGPAVPPEFATGDDYILSLGTVPLFIPWKPMVKTYPGAGWPYGVDLKLVDKDPVEGSENQLMRIRPGRRTLPFRISGATHLFVLQGSVEISVPGSGVRVLSANQYAFLPPALAWSVSNPKQYQGPGAE